MKTSNQKFINRFILIAFTGIIFSSNKANAHCEVPCGIYDDSVRVALLHEHISTIEKAMNQIIDLSKAGDVNYNQLVRWINTKEKHAELIQEIVSQYFLHQRIIMRDANTEGYDKYITQLALMHQLLVYSMKAKQTTDLQYIEKLRKSLNLFEDTYFHTHVH